MHIFCLDAILGYPRSLGSVSLCALRCLFKRPTVIDERGMVGLYRLEATVLPLPPMRKVSRRVHIGMVGVVVGVAPGGVAGGGGGAAQRVVVLGGVPALVADRYELLGVRPRTEDT